MQVLPAVLAVYAESLSDIIARLGVEKQEMQLSLDYVPPLPK